MKKVMLSMVMVLGLAASAKAASNFGIQAPPDWTPTITTDNPNVSVNSWFTENGVTITEGVFIGPMQPGELRPIDATVFEGTGRTICLNATAEIVGAPATRVTAVPACSTFPFGTLVPPVLRSPAEMQ